jgi:DNA (cytosine-5)-methyltransferase 1
VPTEAVPAHDLLTAGFPCQSFSRAGDQLGLSDSRGDLFYEIVRLARARQPRALLLENVPNLLRVDNGRARQRQRQR